MGRDLAARDGGTPGPADARQAETLKFLVHKHLLMSHLALAATPATTPWSSSSPSRSARPSCCRCSTCSPCADLAAVGPDVLDSWKRDLLHRLYHRTMRAPGRRRPGHGIDEWLCEQRRDEICGGLPSSGRRPPGAPQQIDALPAAYLTTRPPEQVAADLRAARHDLPHHDAVAWGQYLPETAGRRVHRRHPRADHARHLPQADRRADQPGPGDPLGRDQHPGRRPGARPLLGPRPRLRRRAAARAAGGRSTAALVDVAAERSRVSRPSSAALWARRRSGAAARAAAPADRRSASTTAPPTASRSSTSSPIDRTGLLYAITRTLFELGLSVLAGQDRHVPGPGGRRVLRDRCQRGQNPGRSPTGGHSPTPDGRSRQLHPAWLRDRPEIAAASAATFGCLPAAVVPAEPYDGQDCLSYVSSLYTTVETHPPRADGEPDGAAHDATQAVTDPIRLVRMVKETDPLPRSGHIADESPWVHREAHEEGRSGQGAWGRRTSIGIHGCTK